MLILSSGFAANIGIPFKTPEEFFLEQASDPLTEVFDPSLYTKSSLDQPGMADSLTRLSYKKFPLTAITVPKPFSRKHTLELVIFCGSPGAGKSTFYWNHMEPLGYERVNQDKLGTVRMLPGLFGTTWLTAISVRNASRLPESISKQKSPSQLVYSSPHLFLLLHG